MVRAEDADEEDAVQQPLMFGDKFTDKLDDVDSKC
jgi:hypothetical protein